MPTKLTDRDVWIRSKETDWGANVRLFCLPYAGGGASTYRSWSAGLPGIGVLPIQLPGREERLSETPISSMRPLVEELATTIQPLLDRTYAIFGHSMGARIAYELTRELRRRGAPVPAILFVSGCKAPHIPRVPTPPVATLPDALFAAMLQRMNGTPPEVFDNPELMRAVLPTLRADFMVVDGYQYADEPGLDLPISVFGGTTDADAREDDLLAWEAHTRRGFRLRMLPGGHFAFRSRESEVLRGIAADLASAEVA